MNTIVYASEWGYAHLGIAMRDFFSSFVNMVLQFKKEIMFSRTIGIG